MKTRKWIVRILGLCIHSFITAFVIAVGESYADYEFVEIFTGVSFVFVILGLFALSMYDIAVKETMKEKEDEGE